MIIIIITKGIISVSDSTFVFKCSFEAFGIEFLQETK